MNCLKATAILLVWGVIIILATGCVDKATIERAVKDIKDKEVGKIGESVYSETNSLQLVMQKGKIKVYYMQHWINRWNMHGKYIVVNEETGAVAITGGYN